MRVPDINRSTDFYVETLGFRTVNSSNGKLGLGTGADGEEPIVALSSISDEGGAPRSGRPPRAAGLYHFAILFPKREHLAAIYRRLLDQREGVKYEGAADHLVSESIYIRDPDFNGIELTWDKPIDRWPRADHTIRMDTLPLDLGDLLASDGGATADIPRGTTIGHVHFHVSNLAQSMQHYTEVLGLHFTAQLPSAVFMAAGEYHHHVAVNTWLGTGIPTNPPEAPGLDHFTLLLPDHSALDELLAHLATTSVGPQILGSGTSREVVVTDPDSIRTKLVVAPSQ